MIGISHFLEHMFFKGTACRGVGVMAQETKAIGGYLNASTIYDYTYYYTVVPSGAVSQALDIQADALIHPLFDAEEMEREKEVIIQELKRKYDNPDPYAWEKLVEMAFSRHRIRRWRMGRESDIRGYERDSMLAYYQRYYRPSNTALVIVGDFDVGRVTTDIEKLYSSLPGGNVDRETSLEEPAQEAPRMSRITGDVTQALVKMGFHAPSARDPDYAAVTALSTLLGRGRSSRLYRSLKEEKGLVDGIGASFYSTADAGYFTVEADLRPENIAASEEEIWVELDRVKRDPPTVEEVEKIRNIVEANFFAEKEDVVGQAYSLAYFESLGGYQKMIDYVNAMRAVTPAELVRVAEKYFTFSNMSLLEYVPNEVGEGAAYDLRLDSLRKRVATRAEKIGSTPAPATVESLPSFTFMGDAGTPLAKGAEWIQMEGGISLLHVENKGLPLATVAVYFPGGRLGETTENCGISQFVLRTSLKGTERKTADEIAFEMEALGSSVRFETTADVFGYSMNVLSRNLDPAMELLSDIITRPQFPEHEIERERAAVLAALRRNRDDMFSYPIELFYSALYGQHPYGLPRNGTEETITSLHREQLIDWYNQSYQWKKMVVAVVGDVDRKRAMDLVHRSFAISGDSDEEKRAQIIPVIPSRGVRQKMEERERKQTGMVIGFSGVSLRDDRYFALEVLRNILSGMGGRLFMELREKRSLAYTVTAFNIALLRGGAFFTYIATSPEKEEEARELLLNELVKVTKRAPSDAELKAAKAYAKGSYAIAMQGTRAVSYELIYHFMTGRGLEGLVEYDRRIESVNAEQVRHVAEEIINPEQSALGIVRGKIG